MYLAFLIAYTCFHIHTDSIDSRFGLSVGSLFAVIGNKYIVDSSLPDSTSFTLVDTLHGLTLFFYPLCSCMHSLFTKIGKTRTGTKSAEVRFDRQESNSCCLRFAEHMVYITGKICMMLISFIAIESK